MLYTLLIVVQFSMTILSLDFCRLPSAQSSLSTAALPLYHTRKPLSIPFFNLFSGFFRFPFGSLLDSFRFPFDSLLSLFQKPILDLLGISPLPFIRYPCPPATPLSYHLYLLLSRGFRRKIQHFYCFPLFHKNASITSNSFVQLCQIL